METSLVLIRHAETVWNREGRMQGFLDSPLSPRGQEQAARLGLRLSARPFTAVYTSDAPRCLETTRIAFSGSGLKPGVLPGLRERNLGQWEGRLWKEVAESAPEEAKVYKKDPSFRPPGGETWNELQARLMSEIEKILSAHPGGRIAVVTSGGSLRAAVFGVMSIPAALWPSWATWNTGLSRLDRRDGNWRLIKYNDVGHLSGTGDGHAVF